LQGISYHGFDFSVRTMIITFVITTEGCTKHIIIKINGFLRSGNLDNQNNIISNGILFNISLRNKATGYLRPVMNRVPEVLFQLGEILQPCSFQEPSLLSTTPQMMQPPYELVNEEYVSQRLPGSPPFAAFTSRRFPSRYDSNFERSNTSSTGQHLLPPVRE